MMKMISRMTGIALLLCLLVGGSGCILHDILTDLVAKNRAYVDFEEYHESASWTTPDTLDNYGKDLRQALEDMGYSADTDTIKSAALVAAHYGVIDIPVTQTHDWLLGGAITVRRLPGGTAQTLIDYTDVSVQDILDKEIAAELNGDGVAVINQVLDDLIGILEGPDPWNSANDPVLEFAVVNGSVAAVPGGGPPSSGDPLEFDWRAWITMEIVIEKKVENVYDFWR
jgi:hypothetical protein